MREEGYKGIPGDTAVGATPGSVVPVRRCLLVRTAAPGRRVGALTPPPRAPVQAADGDAEAGSCLLYTSPSPRDGHLTIRRQRQMCIRDRCLLVRTAAPGRRVGALTPPPRAPVQADDGDAEAGRIWMRPSSSCSRTDIAGGSVPRGDRIN